MATNDPIIRGLTPEEIEQARSSGFDDSTIAQVAIAEYPDGSKVFIPDTVSEGSLAGVSVNDLRYGRSNARAAGASAYLVVTTVPDEYIFTPTSGGGYVSPPLVPLPDPIQTSEDKDYESTVNATITFVMLPEVPVFDTPHVTTHPASLQVVPLPIPLRRAFQATVTQLIGNKVEGYFDATRVLKTVLNFGNDFQVPTINWAYSPTDPTGATILAKLYRPLPSDIVVKDQLWISRELAPTIIDHIFADYLPVEPPKLYLRPPNKDITVAGRSGANIDNVNLRRLLSTGSFNTVRPTDPVLEEWFTTDIDQAELNVDYSDYRNFVFFGSAQHRLIAFSNKLRTLENLESIILLNSSSLAGTGSANITASLSYPSITKLADERLNLIQGFDPYERFLYYQSGVAYSASLTTNDVGDALYYNSDCTWPKISGSLVPVASASSWLTDQLTIAAAYDTENQSALANMVPEYLKSDTESDEYLTFLGMIGHQFDTLKLYIDHMPNIYDRNSDPSVGLSPDLVWTLASSLGINLPNQYAVKNLVDYTIGEVGQVSPTVYRRAAAETWKRFLHNQIFMMKTKGTRASLRALANTYGILPSTLQIRESSTPGTDGLVPAFEQFEEQTNALQFILPSYVRIPWATSSLQNTSVELRFASTFTSRSVILNASNWGLTLEPLTGSYGRVAVRDASDVIVASSSYFPVFGGDFFSVLLRKNSTQDISFYVKRAEGDDIVDNFEYDIPSGAINFTTSPYINLGGSGSFYGTPLVGYIDEFRVWGEELADSIFDEHVQYPGLYNGNSTTSTRDALWARLSFSKPQNLGITSSIANESPWARTLASTDQMKSFATFDFPNQPQYPFSTDVIVRNVVRYAPLAGANNFSTNKVIIAPPATINTFASSSIPVLAANKSTVSLRSKAQRSESTNTVGFFFSVSDAINDSIIRSFGTIDLQDLLGDPADQYNSTYSALERLNELYWTSYAYNYNINSFVDFVRNLLGPLFDQARDLIPARTKLLGGIVHEPHILERNKIKFRPINVTAGQLTRDTDDTQNLDAIASPSDMFVFGGEVDNTEGIFSTDTLPFVGADLPEYDVELNVEDTQEITSEFLDYDSLVDIDMEEPVHADFVSYNEDTNTLAVLQNILIECNATSYTQLTPTQRAYLSHALSSYRSTNGVYLTDIWNRAKIKAELSISGSDAFPTIVGALSDFDDIAAYSYFTHPDGLWAVPSISYTRSNQRILRDRGTWAVGTSYLRNDFVMQSGTVGDGATGNGHEYLCVSTNNSFISQIAPYLDTANWKAMTYVPTDSRTLKEVILYSGSVSVAPSGSTHPNPHGYLPQHYRNTRDTRRGILNARWYGCLQTQDTTLDGKSPVEVFVSAGERLVVANGTDPVQSPENQAGPILNIQ